MKSMTLFAFSTLGIGLTAAACSSSSAKPTTDEYNDTAQAIASTTSTGSGTTSGGDVASMADTVSLSLGVSPPGISLSGDGHFHGNHLGLDYNYALTCKGVGGVVGACGPTTDQATVDIAWSGNLNTTGIMADVTRNGSWTVTGLQSDTATFSGDSSFSFDATLQSIFRPGVTATYSFDASASYDAVKIAMQQRLVIGGSAKFDITAHHMVTGTKNDVDATFDVHAELAFAADHTATLTLDGDQHYSLNLSTGVVVRVN